VLSVFDGVGQRGQKGERKITSYSNYELVGGNICVCSGEKTDTRLLKIGWRIFDKGRFII
jgi:hypothetical protein